MVIPTADRADQLTSDARDADFYIKSGSIRCGSETIEIVSSCMSVGESGEEPFCFSQELSFVDKRRRAAKSILYRHGMRRDGQNFIVALKCLGNTSQLAAVNTNFANCGNCEWIDVYSLSGEYQGSIGDPGRDLPSAYKKFGPDQDSVLSAVSDAPSVAINRNP